VIAEQTSAGTEESAASAAQLSAGMRTFTNKAHRLAEIARELSVGISHFSLTQMKGTRKSSKEGDIELALMD
jgi:hypothetical protein